MSAALSTVTSATAIAVEFNREQLDVLKRTAGDGKLSDAEFSMFIEVCKRSKLDPFRKQIYAIARGGKMTIQTSIDGFRVIAQRTGEYEGQAPAMWCGEDGKWTDSWVSARPPAGCRVGVYRKGHREPLVAFARFASYAQENLWRKMPEVMIAKCAEALALRKAFPEDLSGLYTNDEMAQADSAVTADGEVVSLRAVPVAAPADPERMAQVEAFEADYARMAREGTMQGHGAIGTAISAFRPVGAERARLIKAGRESAEAIRHRTASAQEAQAAFAGGAK